MKNSDHLTEQEIEETLVALMSECAEALARGQDPTSLLEQIADLPPEIRWEFAKTVETLKDLQEVLPASKNSQENLRAFGKFRLLRILGQGSFGVVWLAEDTALRRKVALKIPHLHRQLSPEAADRFIREARAAASLEHPNLVPLLEIGQVDGLDYLASVYCEGPTLAEWMQSRPANVSFEQIARLMEKLAQAGAHMHERGVIHRDLKPSNVLLFPATHSTHGNPQSLDDAVPRITDFGLARRHEISETLTRTGIILGTPAYMAPEQAWGRPGDVGHAADIYALGVILYELIAGQPPYQAEIELEMLRAKENEPVSLRRRNRAVPRDLDTICLKCLNPEPAKRYVSMTALAEDLSRYLEGRPITARRSGIVERTASSIRRRPFVAALTAIVPVMLLGLIATGVWIGIQEDDIRRSREKVRKEVEDRETKDERNQAYAAQMREAGRIQANGKFDQLKDILHPFEPGGDQEDIRGFEWHYLWGFAPREFPSCRHDGYVVGLTYSSDGQLCASAGLDRTIRIFNRSDGSARGTLMGHTIPARNLAFVASNTELVSTAFHKRTQGYDGELIQWDLSNGSRIRQFTYRQEYEDFGHPMFAIAQEADAVFIVKRGNLAERDHQVFKLDLKTGQQTEVFPRSTPREVIAFVATTPRADLLAISFGVDVITYDPRSAKTIASKRFESPIHAGCFSHDGTLLVLSHGFGFEFEGRDHRIEICNPRTLEVHKTIVDPEVWRGPSFDLPGERLVACRFTAKRPVRVWDARTGLEIPSPALGFAFHSVEFSPTGNQLLLGGDDGIVRIRAFGDRPAITLPGPQPKSEAWSVVFSKDGEELWTGYDHEEGGNRETLRRWNWKKKSSQSLEEHPSTVAALTMKPDGKQVASASFDRTIRLWEPASNERPKVLQGHQGPVRAVAYRPDGRHIASGGSDHIIRIWSVEDGKSVKSLQGHKSKVRCLAYSADGKMLITSGNDKSVKIWDAKSYELIREIKEFDNVQAVSCCPNEPLVATGNEKGEVNVWNLKTGTLVRSMSENGGKVRAVAFSPDGRTIASGGEGKTVRLRQTATGQELLTLPCDAFINGLAFDSRNRTLAAALHDGTVKIWTAD